MYPMLPADDNRVVPVQSRPPQKELVPINLPHLPLPLRNNEWLLPQMEGRMMLYIVRFNR